MAPQTVSGGLHLLAQFSLSGAAHRTKEEELQLKYLSFLQAVLIQHSFSIHLKHKLQNIIKYKNTNKSNRGEAKAKNRLKREIFPDVEQGTNQPWLSVLVPTQGQLFSSEYRCHERVGSAIVSKYEPFLPPDFHKLQQRDKRI